MSTRKSLSRVKDPMSFALPTLFDNPNDDWQNHGEYKWRGLFDSHHEYLCDHLDEKDPATGGLRLVRFNIARTICKDLQLKDGDDHITILRRDGNPALVSWYWSDGSHNQNEATGTEGRVLVASRDFLVELCNRYRSELIVQLVLTRYGHTYQRGFPSRDNEEKCYRYALFSPKLGVH